MAKKKRGTVYVPPLPPQSAVASNMGLQGLVETYRTMLASLRLQGAAIGGTFKQAKTDIAGALSQNLTDVEAGAIDRGTLGSSTDLEQRIQARADASRALADARAARQTGLGQIALDKQLATTQLNTGLSNWQAQRAAEQSAIATDQLATGTIPGSGATAGSGGGGQGGTGAATPRLSTEIDHLLNRLDAIPRGTRGALAIEEQLYALWQQRNKARRRAGLPPEPMQKLVRLIRESRENRVAPAGPSPAPAQAGGTSGGAS